MTVTTPSGATEVVEERPADEVVVVEEPPTLLRYSFFERVLHWTVAVTFVALLVSGLALAYPRLAWLSVLFGGGQTMRVAHPWIGVVFTAGLVLMLLVWGRGMLLQRVDWAWFRRLGRYASTGHTGLDVGRWNGGQKAYFWISLLFGIVLLASGLPLWDPDLAGRGLRQLSRLSHHAAFLIMVGGFIIHVLLSAFLFPGTMTGMTEGRVTRAWAAWHHPRWFREQTSDDGGPAGEAEAEARDAVEADENDDQERTP